jgi:hypothetical protein
MIDEEDRVQPIEPISGLKTYRVQPSGAEERPPQKYTAKKRPPKPPGSGENHCLITADKVDCKV